MTRNDARRPLLMLAVCAFAGVVLFAACTLDSPAGIEEVEPAFEEEAAAASIPANEGVIKFREQLLRRMMSNLVLERIDIDRSLLDAPVTPVDSWKRIQGEIQREPEAPWTSRQSNLEAPGSGFKSGANSPVFRIDGREMSEAELSAISPDRIERIEIMKGPAAERILGERAKHGLIDVFTKQKR